MIEKIKYGWQAGGDFVEPTREGVFDKINELVDAVNVLQCKNVHIESDLQDLMYPKEIKCEPAENGKCAKNAQDPYAEQRGWIGKLCKFWDIDNNNLYYGPLTKIHDTSPYCYECNHKMCYAQCEPVTDDIIYKGE